MRFTRAIDLFIDDMRSAGRINSALTERSYRDVLDVHAQDTGNTTPEQTDRGHVKTTLRRWENPNTQRTRRAILVTFYDWMMEEGYRADNPARQTRRPKRKPTKVYRLTRAEAATMLAVARSTRERRAIYLGICAGLRNAELRGLQGRHFRRPGYIWVSADIAKGARERWVPVLADLEPVVSEIAENVAAEAYVLPAERWRDPGSNTRKGNLDERASSSQALRSLVMRVAKRAGIHAHVHPHLMRHAFGDHIAKHAGLKNAQALMGHATVDTTADTYTGAPTLDELSSSLQGFTFGPPTPDLTDGQSVKALETAENVDEHVSGIEPVKAASRPVAQYFTFDSDEIRDRVALYVAHFAGGAA